MKAKKSQKASSHVVKPEEAKSKVAEAEPVRAIGSELTKVADTKVSRRTLMKGTAAVAAVVGVSSVAMSGRKIREQGSTTSSASSSTQSYVTITPTATNTATVPPAPPILATNPFATRTVTLNVNGTNYNVIVAPRTMLVDVLREDLDLIATKRPCNRMSCGACTVLVDGVPHESCTLMAIRMVGHNIVTSEIAKADPVVNALQQAWVTADGGQCNYCGPGQIMAATALLKSNPNPTVPQIKAALSGNLCRCGNYMHIIAAVQLAATNLGGA
jgi:aerobic-type carbon monoxide dehydrogenase small subunit (CoxS/CutS family)